MSIQTRFTRYINKYTELTEQQRHELLFAMIEHLGFVFGARPSSRVFPRSSDLPRKQEAMSIQTRFTRYINKYTELTEQQRHELLFAMIEHLGLSVYLLTDATKNGDEQFIFESIADMCLDEEDC